MKNTGCSLFVLASMLFAQCQSTQAAENISESNLTDEDITITVGSWKSNLTFLSRPPEEDSAKSNDAGNPIFTLAAPQAKSIDIKDLQNAGVERKAVTKNIANLCKLQEIPSTTLTAGTGITTYIFGAVTEYAADKVSSYFIGMFEKKLTSTLKSYSDNYGASISPGYFYTKSEPIKELNSNCFRFTRKYDEITTNSKTGKVDIKEKIALEFIGQITITPTNSAIKIRPLRLAYFKPKAKTSNNTIVLSLNLKIDSVWLTESGAQSEQTINLDFPATKIKAEQLNLKDCGEETFSKREKEKCVEEDPYVFNHVKNYPVKDWTNSPPFPIIPISDGATGKAGDVILSMSVVEVGTPPKYLDDLIALFNDKKDGLEAQLKDAFTTLVSNQ